MDFVITGNIGVNGALLSLIIHQQGHRLSGIALQPEVRQLFEQARLEKFLENDFKFDIRCSTKLCHRFKKSYPDIVTKARNELLVELVKLSNSFTEYLWSCDELVISTALINCMGKNPQELEDMAICCYKGLK